MDELEVQLEIACWAQDHPESSTINWKNGNEPWVSFSGKRCTLHVGLGGLTWSIEVPSGYQTTVDPSDGKRKRLWEPLDYLDTVIVQSRTTPFRVSVVDHSNNILDLSTGLELEFAEKASLLVAGSRSGAGFSDDQQQKIQDMLIGFQLQDSKSEEGPECTTAGQSSMPLPTRASNSDLKISRRSLIISNACFAALKAAETLAEVLDAILGLAKLYNKQLSSKSLSSDGSTESSDLDHNGEGNFLEDADDDDHLFATEMAIKWSYIAAQVNHARDACARAAADGNSRRARVLSRGSAVDNYDSKVLHLKDEFHGLVLSSPSRSGSQGANESDVPLESHILKLQDLTVGSPPGETCGPPSPSDSDEGYTFVFPRSSSGTPDICKDSKLQLADDDASAASVFQIDKFRCDSHSDSDGSDSSWEMASFSDHDANSNPPKSENISDGKRRNLSIREGIPVLSRSSSMRKHKRKLQQMYPALMTARPQVEVPFSSTGIHEPTLKKATAEYWEEGPESGRRLPQRESVKENSCNSKWLEWCDIAFNPESFSVECTIHLSEFMDNPAAATALGFAVEHPLRVEIVPNKKEVDALAWTGGVEVYVSQRSDWHNHISEEICGLLCLVPTIVQTYFHQHVPPLIRNHARFGSNGPKGDLFVGVLQTLVGRLININAGGFCCVCGKPSEQPSLLYMQGRSLWPCTENLCRATYTTWEEVSSVDSSEREREENLGLRTMEELLRDDFPYDDRDISPLTSALDVYGIKSDEMNYGQRIRALARIELWNQKDPDTPISDSAFLYT